jgi:hypothetical protein
MNAFSDHRKTRTPTQTPIIFGKAHASASTGNAGTLFRSANCACGGSCPACQKKSNDINISEPADAAEIEADQIADKVMRMPTGNTAPVASSKNSSSAIQRKCSACEDDEKIVQRKPVSSGSNAPSQSPAHVSNALSSGGRPLNTETRHFFESRMGHDFSNVRVHSDSSANHSARAIDAKAYTIDNNIVFGQNQYKPESESGKHLLAHELAHVVQSDNSSATINRQMIYRQPANGSAGDLAAIDYEIQMLSEMPVMDPLAAAAVNMQLMQLLKRRDELLRGGAGTYATAPTKPKTAVKKPATGNVDDDFYSSLDDMTQLELDQMHQQLQDFNTMAKGGLVNQNFQFKPVQKPQVAQSGCHVDPYVRSTGASTCGFKRPDDATRATQKAMQMPAPDFSAENAKERAMLDRLNSAHLAWKRTGKFASSSEFSPYEIEKDRIIVLYKRWDLFEKSDPEKDAIKNPLEYYFRHGGEYIKEKERRITMKPFKDRLYAARQKARSQSNYWYSANEANEKMTGEEVWHTGYYNSLFIESEKARVYKEQGALQQLEREEREERQAQDRRNFEIQKEINWEAQGDQLSSPATILQPLAMAALGVPIASIYTGMQMGMMGNEAYQACKDGFSADCALSAAPIVATVVIHQATKPSIPARSSMPKLAPAAPTIIEPIVKPSIAEPVLKSTITEPAVQSSVTAPAVKPPAIKPAMTEPAAKPSVNPPAAEPPAIKPAATEPVVKPAATEPVIKPSATEPAVKPAETQPTAKPATTKPPVNPRQAMEEIKLANEKRITELDDKIRKHQTKQKKYNDDATRIDTERETPDFQVKAKKAKKQASNERRLADEAAAERQNLRSQNDFIDKTLNPPPTRQIGPGPGKARGGAHGALEVAGGERNHIPADSATKIPTGKGPAIWMEIEEHKQLNSSGQRTFKPTRQYPYSSADEWRAAQRALIKKGKYMEAIQMDIDDIRSKFGDKYNVGIREMLEYVKTLKPGEF